MSSQSQFALRQHSSPNLGFHQSQSGNPPRPSQLLGTADSFETDLAEYPARLEAGPSSSWLELQDKHDVWMSDAGSKQRRMLHLDLPASEKKVTWSSAGS